ncbi:calcium-activated potassium channel subunit beta-2 [Latimeria chalumnae]|uniref:calcium-activated potassium channel subunit beta-2 n=1 Tax=Latimeria chalumnae TaxID=7897 RepID=UPI0003C13CEA|nr:PREDICTED: calcium-activated potassium channel subunit beta-2 isoform X2 [Latimeria chalumnae]|eukprot:XP_005991985.1 PREDICTED: calcium-activated potassium channel subunit beta-2 isoform X2 [Latimeria chalumnae]
MFLWTAGQSSTQGKHHERRNIYQKIREYDLLDKRKTVTALKPGEDRAILLGFGMIVCSIMMYFILGITMIPLYMESVWTKESQCTLLNATIKDVLNYSLSCGSDCWIISQYPCLQVYVNLTSFGEELLLYHTEETRKANSKCSYIPKFQMAHNESLLHVEAIRDNFKKYQPFPCYYDPAEKQRKSVLLTRLHGPKILFHFFLWPSCMLIGGTAIVAMVKLNQYLSLLCERISKISR